MNGGCNDCKYRSLVERLEMETGGAKSALDVRDFASLEFWLQAMDRTKAELADFMATHVVGG